MKIIFISRVCSKNTFLKLFTLCKIKPQQQAQKYHYLLVSGLGKFSGIKLIAISDLPANYGHIKKYFVKFSNDNENNVKFIYLPKITIPILGHILTFLYTLINVIRISINSKEEDVYIVCDVLNYTISVASKIGASLLGIKTVGIITDIPYYMKNYKKNYSFGQKILQNIYVKLSNLLLKKHDLYIVLSEQMVKHLEIRRPFIIIEGIVETKEEFKSSYQPNKYPFKVIMYAGSLLEKYGVKILLEAFIKLRIPEVELWIFGSGELEEEIKKYELMDRRIIYFGVYPNEEIVEEEKRVTLLVNPRPSNEEFTKYSFPSKLMEYMASGTPVLTTKLASIPDEYKKYLLFFEGESVEDISRGLEDVLKMSETELNDIGMAAKRFVMKEKNNIVQAERLVSFLASNGKYS